MPELMTLEELAQQLRLTRKTVYGLLKQGNIPGIRIGRKWRFDREAIDSWLRQGGRATGSSILVIDDDQSIQSLIKDILETQNHLVETAGTGTEGLQHVKQRDFDLIFLDLKLPGMDGAEVFREIRRIKPNARVIIITGYPDSEMLERALKEGPFGVMSKPFTASDIVSTVDTFLMPCRTGCTG